MNIDIPSSDPGVAVSEAVTPTREDVVLLTPLAGLTADEAEAALDREDDEFAAANLDDFVAELPATPDRVRYRARREDPPDTLSTSPTEPSPVEPESSTCSTGASEGAPPDEHWAVAELRLVKDQLWEVTVARDAALLEAERLWKELQEGRAEVDRLRVELANANAAVTELERSLAAALANSASWEHEFPPARSIVEEEPERFAADEMDEPEPADDERRRAIRRLLAHIDAMPPKERARYIRAHRIKDLSSWVHSMDDAKLASALAQFGATEVGE